MPRALLAGVLVSLAACQPVMVEQVVEEPVPVTLRSDDAAYWLEEWHRTQGLSEEQLRVLLAARESEFAESPGPRTRLRLALLLAESAQPVRDQARALRVLRDLERAQASPSANALAALLEQVIGEQRWAGDKLAEQGSRIEQTEARVRELERQLQELTDIEERIQQRD